MKTCNVDRYSVLTGEWVELDAIQEAHCHSDHAGVASGNDTIYLFGGYTEDYSAQSTVVKVEISGDDELSFSTVAPMGIVSFLFLFSLVMFILGFCLHLRFYEEQGGMYSEALILERRCPPGICSAGRLFRCRPN